jgi:CO dehydrogenase nickel-insertion accessory protein CooC1
MKRRYSATATATEPSTTNTLVVACTNSWGGSGKTTTTVHVATELKNMGFRVLVVDIDKQANTTTGMCKSYKLDHLLPVTLQTKAGVVDFLRNEPDSHWEKNNVDHARDCIIALVSDDTGGVIDLLTASPEIESLTR